MQTPIYLSKAGRINRPAFFMKLYKSETFGNTNYKIYGINAVMKMPAKAADFK